jgi:hypothetical protein
MLDDIVCTTSFCAVNVPATVKLSAYDAVWALIVFDADAALIAYEELIALPALVAYEALIALAAFVAYEALMALSTDPLNSPLIEPITFILPVTSNDPDIIVEPVVTKLCISICCVFILYYLSYKHCQGIVTGLQEVRFLPPLMYRIDKYYHCHLIVQPIFLTLGRIVLVYSISLFIK